MNENIVPLASKYIHTAAHLFQAKRLTLARELRGLTKAELAEIVGKTPSSISQFEDEDVNLKPDAATLGQLAMALSVPIQFFTRKMNSDLIHLDKCHFRSLRSASQKDRRKLLAMGSIMYDILEYIDSIIEFPQDKVSQIKIENGFKSDEEIEVFASQTRKNLGLGFGPIHNIIKLLEINGVLVTMMPEACRQVDAFSTWLNGRPFIFLANKGSTTLLRFDAAHELLHLLAHTDVLPGDKELERQANRFAGAFLLPRETFYDECPRRLNWEHFYELSERWGVSVACLVVRAYQLGCITEASYRRAFVQLNKMGERADKQDWADIEKPTLLKKSIEFFDSAGRSRMAENLGVNTPILESLIECNGI